LRKLVEKKYFWRRKTSRMMEVKKELLKRNLKGARAEIAGKLKEKVKLAVENEKRIIQERWNNVIIGEMKKCFKIVKLKVEMNET
jgi:hypothetical protein